MTVGDFDTPLQRAEGSFDEPLAAEKPAAAAPVPPKPTGPQTLVGPDGRRYVVPEASVDMALKNGWKLPDEYAADRELEKQAVHDIKVEDALEAKESHRGLDAFNRFGNEFLMGVPETVNEYNRSAEDNAVEKEAEDKFTEAHRAEVYGAKAAGFLASTVAMPGVGGLGKLAEESVLRGAEETLARKVAGSAAKMAAEGAIYSTPQAAVAASYGDPERAAETMLWGVGLGAALGGGGELAATGGKALVKAAASKAEGLMKPQANGITMLDDVARNILGITDKQAQKLGPQRLARIVERADQEGILGMDPSKRQAFVEAMRKDAGERLGGHLDALEGLLGDEKYAGIGPKPGEVATDFERTVLEKHPEIKSALHEGNYKYFEKVNQAIREAGEEPSFKKLQDVRQSIRAEGKAYNRDSVQAKIAELADATIKKHIEDAAQKLYENGGLKEKFADYLSQKERYEAAKQLLKNENLFKGTGRLPGGLGFLNLGHTSELGLGMLAGHPGLAIADIARQKITKAFLGNKWGLFGKSVSFLRKAAADPATMPFVGGLMAKEGAGALTAHIDALPRILSGSQAVARGEADVVQSLIGSTSGLTKQQQYDKLTAAINQAATDTAGTSQRVGATASVFTGTSVQLGSLVAEKKLQAIAYLQSQIPKNPNPQRPFQRNAEWKPSPQQQRDFLAKVEIASNPMVVWQHYQEGRLTKMDRDVLQAVYPRIYQEMVQKIVETAHDPKGPALSREKRMQLSMFTGMPMDASLRNLPAIQDALNAESQKHAAQQAAQAMMPKPSSRPNMKGPSTQTETQRRTYN